MSGGSCRGPTSEVRPLQNNMLYLFHGSNIDVSAKKAHTLIESLRAKRSDATFVAVGADNWSKALVEEHIGGQGLFSSKYIIFLDRITENNEAKGEVGEFIEAMNESENIFIVLEGKLNADLQKRFDKYATKAVLSETSAAGVKFKKPDFNIFALADAIGSRDPFKSWTIYRQAIDSGLEPESIVGTIFWQVKSMIIAAQSKAIGTSGLNPFVYNKSKKYAENYSAAEINQFLKDLIIMYHDGHRGAVDLELGIERMLLSISSRP